MALDISPLSKSNPIPRIGDPTTDGAKMESGGWQGIVSKVTSYVTVSKPGAPTAQDILKQMSGLMRLQMEITRYQLRVEVVSKVAESAVASLRKLQQSQ